MCVWGELAVENQFLEVGEHDPPSLPPDDVRSVLLQLQKVSNLLLSSRKRHVLGTECHTLCLHSWVSSSHPLALLHTHAAPPDQILLISEQIHMVVFFIYALKTLGDRNKLSLSPLIFSRDTTSTFQQRLDFHRTAELFHAATFYLKPKYTVIQRGFQWLYNRDPFQVNWCWAHN